MSIRPPASPNGASVAGEVHADATVVNTVVATDLCSFTLPDDVAIGDVYELTAGGDLLNNSGANATFTPRVYVGATAALNGDALTFATSATRRKWTLRAVIHIESITAQRVYGRWGVSVPSGTWPAYTSSNEGYGTAAVDLTSTRTVKFNMALGTAAATVDCVLHAAALVRLGKGV